jgi:hypothetical protein
MVSTAALADNPRTIAGQTKPALAQVSWGGFGAWTKGSVSIVTPR